MLDLKCQKVKEIIVTTCQKLKVVGSAVGIQSVLSTARGGRGRRRPWARPAEGLPRREGNREAAERSAWSPLTRAHEARLVGGAIYGNPVGHVHAPLGSGS